MGLCFAPSRQVAEKEEKIICVAIALTAEYVLNIDKTKGDRRVWFRSTMGILEEAKHKYNSSV